MRIERIKTKTKHGFTRTRTYRIWLTIKQRCHNPRSWSYRYYGKRGIYVCKEWAGSFVAFLTDMGPCPSGRHSIDRKNNDQGYSPSNCRWVLHRQQMRNTRRNRWLTFNGRTMIMGDWAAELGIASNTLFSRLRRWGAEVALATPGSQQRAPHRGSRFLSLNGKTQSLSDWARQLGISKNLLCYRIKRWGISKSLTAPAPVKKDTA